ncbi:hypothetical protein MKW98_028273 [Papaver atlanticum]|uniref:Uncharacterized protein n=1 Tax=Papaver atlanticum TaxID=357466 RepID=A0AAD4SVY8_9MAGN|nr:hypothetical protein MKW98_028273 [Papaver atlanticum]
MVKGNRSSSVIIALLVLLVLQQVIVDTSNAEFTKKSRKNCSDSSSLIGECNGEEEMLMDSEVSRRFLAEVNGISYKAIRKDRPVCGAGEHRSYRDPCTPQSVHKYTRGCEKANQCRSD